MLTIYRRHLKSCLHREGGRTYRKCRCPVWVDGYVGGKRVGQSLDTRDWQKAQQVIREWEATAEPPKEVLDGPVTVTQAFDGFVHDAEARGLQESTLKKYHLLKKQTVAFCDAHGINHLRQITLADLVTFRGTWPNKNLGAQKKLEYLRSFFSFAKDNKWVEENLGRKLKKPTVSQSPTLPFTEEQFKKIMTSAAEHASRYKGPTYKKATGENVWRLTTFILLMRYSGLRIGDAVSLERARVSDGKLFLYTAKTGTPVYLPLPEFLLESLNSVKGISSKYFFWSGESSVESAAKDMSRSLRKVFKLAGIPDGHSHRFRDTFAVDLLQAGVPLERVSMLLGHTSIKITERHYAPWVQSRQEQLEADVKRVWERASGTDYATPQLHGRIHLVN